MNINLFIISWAGQHASALVIAKEVLTVTDRVTIVFSDPDPDLVLDCTCRQLRRPNHLFWGDKFKACLDACGDDPMLVIHADCQYSDWAHLLRRCHQTVAANPAIGVWAPQIDYVPWDIRKVTLGSIASTPLLIVAHTDGIVFYLAPGIISRMKRARYDANIYGRGIERMFVAAAYARGMFAVIDSSLQVQHPRATSYSRDLAHKQFLDFLTQLETMERIQSYFLKMHRIYKGETPEIPE